MNAMPSAAETMAIITRCCLVRRSPQRLTRTDAAVGGLRRLLAGRFPEPPELSLFRRDLAVEIGCEAGEHVVALPARELRRVPHQPQRRGVKRFDLRDGFPQRALLIGDAAQDCDKPPRGWTAGGV